MFHVVLTPKSSVRSYLGRSLEIDEAVEQEPVCKLLQEKRVPVLIDVPFDVTEGTVFKKVLCKDIPGWRCRVGGWGEGRMGSGMKERRWRKVEKSVTVLFMFIQIT